MSDPNTHQTRYRAFPSNIVTPLSEAKDGLTMIKKFLHTVGLEKYSNLVDTILRVGGAFSTAFKIPSDSDDTGCALALGAKLKSVKAMYPEAYHEFAQQNTRISKAFKAFKKNGYKPFSNDPDQSSIDPRTYFWLRRFIYLQKGNTDLTLITTWMQKISQIEKQQTYRKMPFALNNVDASVTVNVLFGIASTALTDQSMLNNFNDKVGKLFLDNAKMVAWLIKEKVVINYTALTLLYYPPKFAFYWFTARLLHLINNAKENEVTLPSDMVEAHALLADALRDIGTNDLLDLGKSEGSYIVWDDFLGNGDVSQSGNVVHGFEDRTFSTAMVLNALLDIWTVKTKVENDKMKLVYLKNVPTRVQETIKSGIAWLKHESFKYPQQNGMLSERVVLFNFAVSFFLRLC